MFESDSFQRGPYLCLLGNALEALFWQGRWDELATRLPGIDQPDDTKTMHLNLWMAAAAYRTAIGRFGKPSPHWTSATDWDLTTLRRLAVAPK